MASSSHESHSSRTTSTASAASANASSTEGASRTPTSAASSGRTDTRTCQPARPRLTWSSVEVMEATWNGSVWVVVMTGIRPVCRVSGATRAATSAASGRAVTGSRRRGGAEGVLDRHQVEPAPLGLAHQAGPVPGVERVRGLGRRVVPTTVERHRQEQGRSGHEREA